MKKSKRPSFERKLLKRITAHMDKIVAAAKHGDISPDQAEKMLQNYGRDVRRVLRTPHGARAVRGVRKNPSERDAHKTRVIFRVFKRGGDVIALFPDLEETGPGNVMSYQHIGQHGGAHLAGVMRSTRAATREEYAPLHRELESIGYNLQVVKRASRRARKNPAGRPLTLSKKHCVIAAVTQGNDVMFFDGSHLRADAKAATLYGSPLVAKQHAKRLRRVKGVTYVIAPAHWTGDAIVDAFTGTRKNPGARKKVRALISEYRKKEAAGRASTGEIALRQTLERQLPTIKNPASRQEISRAAKRLRAFSGHDARTARRYRRPVTRVGFELGKVCDITYLAKRDGEQAKYRHPFATKSRPSLVAGSDGKSLEIVGGRFQVTSSGITDK